MEKGIVYHADHAARGQRRLQRGVKFCVSRFHAKPMATTAILFFAGLFSPIHLAV
jgi:hypothetical protein